MKSFTEMTKYLLCLPGAEGLFLLSERFSQDPLENHFGHQRARCGRSDNPSVLQVDYTRKKCYDGSCHCVYLMTIGHPKWSVFEDAAQHSARFSTRQLQAEEKHY